MKIQSTSTNLPFPGRLPAGRGLAAALLMLLPAAVAGAQTPESPPPEEPPTGVFTEVVKVEVINVDVTVTDASGRSVAGLGREDFELRLDGKPLQISNFYAEARQGDRRSGRPAFDVPKDSDPSFRAVEDVAAGVSRRSHVVVLIDHTRLRSSNRKRAFNALKEAVDRIDEDALIAVVGVEGGLVFYSDFLFDRQAVAKILDDVTRVSQRTDVAETDRRQIFGELAAGQSGGVFAVINPDGNALMARIQSYAAQEYARSLRSMQQIERVVGTLSGLSGRKVLLYLGEGIPTRPGEGLYVEFRNRFSGPERGLPHQNFNTNYNREVGNYDLTRQMEELAKAANRAEVTIYAVDAESNHGGEIRSALTDQGAWSETVSVIDENYRAPLEFATKATGGRLLQSSGKLADQLGDLFVGIQTFYSLGFTPPDDWQPGSDHRLEVEVKGKGLRVAHRDEVRLPRPDEVEAGAIVAALMYQTVDNPLAIEANPGLAAPRDDGSALLPINIEIPIAKLELLPKGDVHAGSLSIYVSTKDADGNPGAVQKIPFHLDIPGDKMQEAMASSAHYPLPLVLRPGDRQVAIGVRDNFSGRFSAIRLDVSQFSQQL